MPPTVLAPVRALALAALLAATPWRAGAADRPTLVEAATRYGMFKTFLGIVAKAGSADSLNAGPATLFMPTDAAFGHLGQAQRDAIAALSPDGAKRFVEHFVIPGVVLKSNDIDPDITAQDGTSYNVTWYGGRLSLRDHRGPATGPLAFVVDGDDPAGRGMIDAVDAVLLPDALARPAAAPDAAAGVPMPASPIQNGPAPPPADVAAAPIAAVPPPPAESRPATPAPPAPAPDAPKASDEAAPGKAADDVAPAEPAGGNVAAAGTPKSDAPDGPQPALAPGAPPPPDPTAPSPLPARPAYTLAASDLRDWPVKTTGGPTGKVDRIVMGLPDGRIEGITATFGGVFGFGGQRAYIAWPLVTLDPDKKVITARMTAAELKDAPTGP